MAGALLVASCGQKVVNVPGSGEMSLDEARETGAQMLEDGANGFCVDSGVSRNDNIRFDEEGIAFDWQCELVGTATEPLTAGGEASWEEGTAVRTTQEPKPTGEIVYKVEMIGESGPLISVPFRDEEKAARMAALMEGARAAARGEDPQSPGAGTAVAANAGEEEEEEAPAEPAEPSEDGETPPPPKPAAPKPAPSKPPAPAPVAAAPKPTPTAAPTPAPTPAPSAAPKPPVAAKPAAAPAGVSEVPPPKDENSGLVIGTVNVTSGVTGVKITSAILVDEWNNPVETVVHKSGWFYIPNLPSQRYAVRGFKYTSQRGGTLEREAVVKTRILRDIKGKVVDAGAFILEFDKPTDVAPTSVTHQFVASPRDMFFQSHPAPQWRARTQGGE